MDVVWTLFGPSTGLHDCIVCIEDVLPDGSRMLSRDAEPEPGGTPGANCAKHEGRWQAANYSQCPEIRRGSLSFICPAPAPCARTQTAHKSLLGPLSSQALGAASEAGQKSAFETRQRQDERGSHSREERQPAIPRVRLVSPVAPRMGSTAIGGGEGMREQL